MADATHDHLFKLLIIGDSGVGKSSILLRFCDDEFNEKQASTIGVDFKTKFMQVRGKKLKLALWDTAGQERFRTLTSSYYRGAQGIILCYDCTQRSTFDHVKFWQDEVRRYSTNQDAILMLVSNKVDLPDQQVSRTEGEEFAFAQSMMFIETSAKTRPTTLVAPAGTAVVVSLRRMATQRMARNTGRYLNANQNVVGLCELCGLDQDLTVHHLVPKVHWRRMKKRRQVSGKDEPPTAILCRTCHSMVHRTFSHSELGRNYNSIEALEEAGELQKYLQLRRPWGEIQNQSGR